MKIPEFIINNMTWSYSRVSAYEQCPYGWFLNYILEEAEEPMFYFIRKIFIT